MDWLLIPPEHLQPFKKNARSKLRVAAAMGKIVHFLYLAMKNCPRTANQYETIHEMFRDRQFIIEVLKKEAKMSASTHQATYYPYELYIELHKRGYDTALDTINTLWEITNYRERDAWRLMCELLSLNEKSTFELNRLREYILYPLRYPATYKIKDTLFMIIEYEPVKQGLSRMTVYWGSLLKSKYHFGENKRLGLFARFSLDDVDAGYLYKIQRKGGICSPVKWLWYYLPLLRVRRTSYRKIVGLNQTIFKDEVAKCISELWLNADEIAEMKERRIRANLLAAVPLVFPSDALGIPGASQGRLLKLSGERAIFLFEDIVMEAYFSYNSVLPIIKRPGNYIVLFSAPITIPKIIIVLGMWDPDEFDQLSKVKRGVDGLSYKFPTIEEISICKSS